MSTDTPVNTLVINKLTQAQYEALQNPSDTELWLTPYNEERVRNVGEIVQSTIPLTDSGLHLLDGALLSGTGIYATFVTYIAGLVSTYPSLFTTEAAWQTSVTTYGVCGKFVYDSTNNTVRLPKTSSATRYLIDSNMSGTNWYRIYSDGWCEQGGYVSNSTAAVPITVNLIKTMTNTNYTVEVQYEGNTTGGAGSDYNNIVGSLAVGSFVARVDNRNIFWQAKGYVDVSSYKADTIYTYIVTANTTKTEIQSDIDEIASDLNLKAGTDLANLNNAGSIVAAKASMPNQSVYDVLTLGANGSSYTAPSDGWFSIGGNDDEIGTCRFVLRNNTTRFGVSSTTTSSISTGWMAGVLPVKKGEQVSVYYTGFTSAGVKFYFVYADGSKSEHA